MSWKDANYWDQKNPQDVGQVMARKKIKYNMPQEIKEYINVKRFRDY